MPSSFKQHDPVLPLFFPSAMITFLVEKGYSAESLLSNTGLRQSQLLSPDSRASFRQVEQIIVNAEVAWSEANLGLHFGQSLSLLSLGMLGQAAIASKTVGESLATINRYLELRDPLIVFNMERQRQGWLFTFDSPIQLGQAQHFITDAAFSALSRFTSELTGQTTNGVLYEFKNECATDISYYQNMLGDNVDFDAERNAVFISNETLERIIPTANAINLVEAKQYLDSELNRLQHSLGFTQVVRTLLNSRLKNPPTEREVAKTLGHSERNLRRRLAHEDTTYRTLLGDIRQHAAETLLLTTQLKVERIANELGYKNVGNFCRAFKRRLGITPTELRRKQS